MAVRIEMANSFSQNDTSFLETMITLLKEYKKNTDKIIQMMADNKEVDTLLEIQNNNAKKIQGMISKTQEGYINPEIARKVMMAKRQLKEQMRRLEDEIYMRRKKGQDMKQQHIGFQDSQQMMQGFDYEVENRLIREKGSQLQIIVKKMAEVNGIARQTQELVVCQGESLDLVDENLDKTGSNVKEANSLMNEANELQKRSKQKWYYVLGLTGLFLAVFVILMIFVF